MATHPPLKAPYGFRTGKGVASASLRDEVWKVLAVRRATDGAERARMAVERVRADIVLWEVRNKAGCEHELEFEQL